MPTNRKIVFANGEYYHVFNRGVEKRPTFTGKYEYLRAIDSIGYYRYANLPIRYSKYIALEKTKKEDLLLLLRDEDLQVDIVAYCLMGNHFHFLLKQLKTNGIVKFMAKFTNSYTKYFNTKHTRVGPLFQGVFKAVHVDDDEQLIHLSRYIHLNPVAGFVIEKERLEAYPWSSYPQYIGSANNALINAKDILAFFKSKNDYKQFVLDQADYSLKLKMIEHLVIDGL